MNVPFGLFPKCSRPGKSYSFKDKNINDLREALIAQMDRASDYESAGRPFESDWARQQIMGVGSMA